MSGSTGGDTFFEADVAGIDALIAKFNALPDDIYQELVKDMSAEQRNVLAAMRNAAPKKSGKLAGSFNVELDVYPDAVELYITNNAPYARLQDQGGRTRPHRIEARNAKALFFISGKPNMATPMGGKVWAQHVNHPGGQFRGKEFMLKGLTAAKASFVATAENAVATAVMREFKD